MRHATFVFLFAAALGAAELGRPEGAGPLLATRLRAASALPSQEEFHWSGRVARGAAVEIVGVNGEVVAGPAAGELVDVRAVKSARRSRPEDVRIEVVEHADGVTLCAVYPAREGKRPNDCRPGGGRNETSDNDVRVDFRVQVPSGVRFIGRTVNGGVAAEGLDAHVQVHAVNGGVRIATRGPASAETVNGGITASLGSAGDGDLAFETVNGAIIVDLPRALDARVEATTVNGSIDTDFPITIKGRFGPKHMSGTIGRGGRRLVLETVNGSIELRAAS